MPYRLPRSHHLKTWPESFEPVRLNIKTFEYRLNDRNYGTGDILILQEWDPETEKYTGRSETRVVQYILQGGKFGLPGEYVIMGFYPFRRHEKINDKHVWIDK